MLGHENISVLEWMKHGDLYLLFDMKGGKHQIMCNHKRSASRLLEEKVLWRLFGLLKITTLVDTTVTKLGLEPRSLNQGSHVLGSPTSHCLSKLTLKAYLRLHIFWLYERIRGHHSKVPIWHWHQSNVLVLFTLKSLSISIFTWKWIIY